MLIALVISAKTETGNLSYKWACCACKVTKFKSLQLRNLLGSEFREIDLRNSHEMCLSRSYEIDLSRSYEIDLTHSHEIDLTVVFIKWNSTKRLFSWNRVKDRQRNWAKKPLFWKRVKFCFCEMEFKKWGSRKRYNDLCSRSVSS